MRILLVTEDVPVPRLGGAGQHAVVLGNALIEAGHEVHLLGNGDEAGQQHDNGFKGPLHRGIDFRGARWREASTGAFMPPSRPHMARRLWQAICSLPGPWDVVHYHGHNPLLGGLVPASWNFVHTLHDQGSECITKMRFRDGEPCNETTPQACAGCASEQPNGIQRWLSTQAVVGLRQGSLSAFRRHKAIFVSEFLRRRYCAVMGISAGQIQSHVVHNFVDSQRLQAAQSCAQQKPAVGQRIKVFSAGRIDTAKGFDAWLTTMPDTALSRLDVTVAGDGPDVEALRERHAKRGIAVLGWCEPMRVLELTAACDIYVAPSVWDEPCATTVLEALALGRSVFALRRGGTPELAKYGEAGQLRLFEDMDELAGALIGADVLHWPLNSRVSVRSRLNDVLAVYSPTAASAMPQEVAA
jgi:glycosyltransferase involved in cell wall biosynthesis